LRFRRWLVRDRPWAGRLLALARHTVWIEGCRFSLRHPNVTDTVRWRAMLGRYERSERELLRLYLDPALPVVELGGGLGVVSCVTNRRLAQPTRHVVVEANPSLIPELERHRAWNDARFSIVHAAIGYSGSGSTVLRVTDDFLAARVDGSTGEVQVVPEQTFAGIVAAAGFDTCTIVCDIEGAETALVEHEGDALRRHAAMVIMETHPDITPDAVRAQMVDRLAQLGLAEVAAVRKVRVFKRRAGLPTTG
jgi:FkbM family methyltransferase